MLKSDITGIAVDMGRNSLKTWGKLCVLITIEMACLYLHE